MKLLKRNLIPVQYLPATGEESDLNGNQEHTGEFYPVYGDPVSYMGNFSTPSGYTNPTFYGADIRYTNVLLLDDAKADIREDGLFLIQGHTYEIRAVRPSLNVLSIALRRLTEDHPETEPGETEPTGETGETGETGGTEPDTGTVTDDEQNP